MSDNPYAPPKANVDYQSGPFDAPDRITKPIRHAAIAGIVSGCITLLFTLIAMAGSNVSGIFNAWSFLDVALIFGLTFGIWKKSRTCAVSMLVYFVISKIIIFMETQKLTGIVLSVVFIYYYLLGMLGTFAYHKLKKQQSAAPV